MTTPQDPNATVAYDVVSAPAGIPADTMVPADNFPNELSTNDEPTVEAPATTPADNRPLNQKEKMKAGGLGAAAGAAAGIAGTAAAMTYGSDTLHSIEEAGTHALHSVQDFLGIDHAPDQPAAPVQPVPPAPQTTTGQASGPGPDPHAPGPNPHPPVHPVATTNGPENHPAPAPAPEPQPQPQGELVDLDHDGKADAVMVVDEHGNPEMIVDMDHDGVVDGVVIDGDHDGQLDTAIVDSNHDGYADSAQIDTNHDGQPDMVLVDSDGDHGLDTAVVDSNHDGHFTADDTAQATGQDPVVSFTDHQQEGGMPPEGEVAQHDQGAHDNYDNQGDVHEWA